jgi:hypothetical protein
MIRPLANNLVASIPPVRPRKPLFLQQAPIPYLLGLKQRKPSGEAQPPRGKHDQTPGGGAREAPVSEDGDGGAEEVEGHQAREEAAQPHQQLEARGREERDVRGGHLRRRRRRRIIIISISISSLIILIIIIIIVIIIILITIIIISSSSIIISIIINSRPARRRPSQIRSSKLEEGKSETCVAGT